MVNHFVYSTLALRKKHLIVDKVPAGGLKTAASMHELLFSSLKRIAIDGPHANKKLRERVRTILSILILFALWLLLSGIYKPLIVWLGLASSIVAVLAVRRMDIVDGHQLSIPLKPLKFITFLFWLLKEIAISNIAVTKLILSPRMSLRQHFFRVPNTQRSELAAAIYANAITLTPGTLSVEIERDAFWVHAANFSDEDHAALADMDARVTATETGRR